MADISNPLAQNGEAWSPVPGYEGLYEVSSLGRVRSTPRPRTKGGMVKTSISRRGGYPKVSLCSGGVQRTYVIHRLVAAAFLGPKPDGEEIRHLDGNPLNNAAWNLAYGTRSENQQDSVRHGTQASIKKTHCPAGHPYDEVNTRVTPGRPKARYCRACHR